MQIFDPIFSTISAKRFVSPQLASSLSDYALRKRMVWNKPIAIVPSLSRLRPHSEIESSCARLQQAYYALYLVKHEKQQHTPFEKVNRGRGKGAQHLPSPSDTRNKYQISPIEAFVKYLARLYLLCVYLTARALTTAIIRVVSPTCITTSPMNCRVCVCLCVARVRACMITHAYGKTRAYKRSVPLQ